MLEQFLVKQFKALQLSGQSRGLISPRSQVQIPPEPLAILSSEIVFFQCNKIYLKQLIIQEKWLSGRKQQIANLSYNLLYPGFESLFLLCYYKNYNKKKLTNQKKYSTICVKWDCSSIGQSTALSRRKLRVRVSSVPI